MSAVSLIFSFSDWSSGFHSTISSIASRMSSAVYLRTTFWTLPRLRPAPARFPPHLKLVCFGSGMMAYRLRKSFHEQYQGTSEAKSADNANETYIYHPDLITLSS